MSTYSLLSTAPVEAVAGFDGPALAPEWEELLGQAVSPAEKDLVRALAAAGVTVPTLGYETEDGEMIDLAWVDAHVGVTFDGDGAVEGWTFCPADVPQILAALTTNGVM